MGLEKFAKERNTERMATNGVAGVISLVELDERGARELTTRLDAIHHTRCQLNQTQ